MAGASAGYEHVTGRISIPFLTSSHPTSVRFRALDPDEKAKMLGMSGEETRLFNVRAIDQAADIIGITEGEFDAISIDLMGVPAVGVTGASAWKRHHARMFSGFRKVLVFGDGDDAGRKFANGVYESLVGDTIAIRVPMPQGEDPNSMLVNKRDELSALIEEASR